MIWTDIGTCRRAAALIGDINGRWNIAIRQNPVAIAIRIMLPEFHVMFVVDGLYISYETRGRVPEIKGVLSGSLDDLVSELTV